MKLTTIHLRLAGFLLAVIITICDQWSKTFIIALASKEAFPIKLLPFFDIVLVANRGISFGMLSATSGAALVLPFLLSCIVVALVIWLLKATEKSVIVALGLIIGGAQGNIIDRVRAGSVTDFLDFHVGSYHWPAFNVADSAIFIGVVIFIFTNIIAAKPLVKENV